MREIRKATKVASPQNKGLLLTKTLQEKMIAKYFQIKIKYSIILGIKRNTKEYSTAYIKSLLLWHQWRKKNYQKNLLFFDKYFNLFCIKLSFIFLDCHKNYQPALSRLNRNKNLLQPIIHSNFFVWSIFLFLKFSVAQSLIGDRKPMP